MRYGGHGQQIVVKALGEDDNLASQRSRVGLVETAAEQVREDIEKVPSHHRRDRAAAVGLQPGVPTANDQRFIGDHHAQLADVVQPVQA